jgi:hypothetical protein
MTKEDLELIKYWQRWRRDESEDPLPMPNPTEVGQALDRMIAYCELCMKLESEV